MRFAVMGRAVAGGGLSIFAAGGQGGQRGGQKHRKEHPADTGSVRAQQGGGRNCGLRIFVTYTITDVCGGGGKLGRLFQ